MAPLLRSVTRERWRALERLTRSLAGQADEADILRTALLATPALFGTGLVEVYLWQAGHRPAVCAAIDVANPGPVEVKLLQGRPPEPAVDTLTIDLVGAATEIGVVRFTGCAPRSRRQRRTLAVGYTHLLASSLGSASALAEERRLVAETTRTAHQDGLTRLGNRRLLTEWGDHLLGMCEARGTRAALLLLDLDDFKRINDTLGHDAGDQVLAELGGRINDCVRQSDLAVRLGGDEFAVLATDLRDAEEATQLAARLLDAVAGPILVDEVDIRVRASAGVAMFGDDGQTVSDLLRAADVAMYASKIEGGTLTSAGSLRADANPTLVEDLVRGLREDQLVLHYEPQVDVRTGRVTGFDALVRWQHPDRGLLLPEDFLPVAERAGLMGRLAETVLDRALADHRLLDEAVPGARVAVTVSQRNLLRAGLVPEVERLLAKHEVAPPLLTLEVAEPGSGHGGSVAAAFEGLERLGCRLSVGEYGEGASSLTALAQHPGVHEVKLSPRLVARIAEPGTSRLVGAIVTAAHSLALTVVAVGVDTAATLGRLRELGCDMVQGGHLHAAGPVEQVAAWAADRDIARFLPLGLQSGVSGTDI